MRTINPNSNLSSGLLKSSKKSNSPAFNKTDLTNYFFAWFVSSISSPVAYKSLPVIHFHPGKSRIWFPPQGSCLYICRINGEARVREVSTWISVSGLSPNGTRGKFRISPKVFREYRPQTMAVPGPRFVAFRDFRREMHRRWQAARFAKLLASSAI